MNDQEYKLWSWVPIDPSDLKHIDLREVAESAGGLAGAYRIDELAYPEAAEALVVPFASDRYRGRIGIAWGGNAVWGDVNHLWATDLEESDELPDHICDGTHDIEQAIDDWLNDEAAWDARR